MKKVTNQRQGSAEFQVEDVVINELLEGMVEVCLPSGAVHDQIRYCNEVTLEDWPHRVDVWVRL